VSQLCFGWLFGFKLPSRPLLLRCLPDQYGTTFALFEKIESEERKLKDGFQSVGVSVRRRKQTFKKSPERGMEMPSSTGQNCG
jgi:hypothetical protein